MGAVQTIPVVGEIVTVIDSGVKVVAAGSCALVGEIMDEQDAKNAAKKFVKDAGNSWVEYSERNIIVAPVRATIHGIAGDEKEAVRVVKKMGKSAEQVIDSTPVVGHIKGVGHYIAGDTEHGHDCMKGASRTLAVVGAGALTGGVGGGVVLGGLAGASSGFAYDGTVSVIESNVKNEDRPYGVIASIDQAIQSDKKKDGYGVINSVIDVGYSLTGDFVAGSAAAKTSKTLNKASKQRKALKKSVGKEGAKDVLDTAKKLKEVTKDVKGDSHVCTKAKNLETGEKAYGTNRRCRQELRMNKYASEGEASGYNSKTNAKKGNVGEFSREAGVLERAANERNMDIEPRVGNRAPRACAEHQAFDKLGTNGAEAEIRTTSVTSHNGNITAIERCNNCVQFGELMGDVVTDRIHGMPVPTSQFVLDTSMPAIKTAGMYAAGAVIVCSVCGESDDCSCEKKKVHTECTKVHA
ncbi:uncharacterized protein LOC116289905 [Actinia tenebrosa]|uniref:Uncharacterized protein LOC116289905 n=1 Tax=Actinia tenebrosa TaxID=6105 RepID=A0A6P8HC56_ACTTE|nr:uncharacterized protein LOC116289905 [Actinia tenebrosa]